MTAAAVVGDAARPVTVKGGVGVVGVDEVDVEVVTVLVSVCVTGAASAGGVYCTINVPMQQSGIESSSSSS